jgi:ATP-dependent Clp protease ATP-binding subunit ClpC
VAEHELQLDLSKEAKELLVDKGWDPAMGARPLRRAIQRYVEDPLADEVLKAGQMAPGSTVQVERDSKGDEEDHPLKLTIIKPRKRPAKKKTEPEKVGVGAGKKDDGGDEPSGDGGEPESSGDGDKS